MRGSMIAVVTLYFALDLCVRTAIPGKVTVTPGSSVAMLSRGHEQVVAIGSKVFMNCEFRMDDFDLFANPVVWVKYQQGESTNVNIMGSVKEPFASTRRYDSTLIEKPPKYTVQLRIKDVNPSDIGNYTCELRGKKSMILGQVSYSLHVLAPIKFLSIVLERNLIDLESPNQHFTLTEDQPVPLKCLSHGGYPPPEMTVLLGDRNITDRFRTSHSADVTGPRGLRILQYRTSCWTREFTVGSAEDGKVIQCIANIPGVGSNVTNTTIYVNYAPNVTCLPAEAEIDDENVQLHCFVRSRPGLTSLFWFIGNMTIAPTADSKNEFWSLVRDRGDGVFETILFVRLVRPQNFRIYSLMAENKIGMTSHEVELRHKLGSRSRTPEADPLTIVPLSSQGKQEQTYYYKNYPMTSPAIRCQHYFRLARLLTSGLALLQNSIVSGLRHLANR